MCVSSSVAGDAYSMSHCMRLVSHCTHKILCACKWNRVPGRHTIANTWTLFFRPWRCCSRCRVRTNALNIPFVLLSVRARALLRFMCLLPSCHSARLRFIRMCEMFRLKRGDLIKYYTNHICTCSESMYAMASGCVRGARSGCEGNIPLLVVCVYSETCVRFSLDPHPGEHYRS